MRIGVMGGSFGGYMVLASLRHDSDRISPLKYASRIDAPLFVAQGKNDPRVPYTEAEQIAKALRGNGQPVGFLMFENEGHGFRKKSNSDYFGAASMLFWQQHLLDGMERSGRFAMHEGKACGSGLFLAFAAAALHCRASDISFRGKQPVAKVSLPNVRNRPEADAARIGAAWPQIRHRPNILDKSF